MNRIEYAVPEIPSYEGNLELPPYEIQVAASRALAEIRPMKTAVEAQLREIEKFPSRLLTQAFENKNHPPPTLPRWGEELLKAFSSLPQRGRAREGEIVGEKWTLLKSSSFQHRSPCRFSRRHVLYVAP